LRLM